MNDQVRYTGKDLIAMGCAEGPGVGSILRIVNSKPHSHDDVLRVIEQMKPAPVLNLRESAAPCEYNISARNEIEQLNVESVAATMDVVLRTPVVTEGIVMPDACPAGPIGTIPVGGVVAAKDAIIPGMHSADM